MKIRKQFLQAVSAILCFVLVLSLSITAFAQNPVVNFVLSSAVFSEDRNSYVAQDTFKSGDVLFLKLTTTQISNLGGMAFSVQFETNSFEFMENKSQCLIPDSQPQYFLDTKSGKLSVIYENGNYNKDTSLTGAVFYLAFSVKNFTENSSPLFSIAIDDLYDNSLAQKDIESNLSDSITVHLSADKVSAETLALFKKLENIVYPDSKEDIDTAMSAYNQLSPLQKEILSNKHPSEYNWISTALSRYNRLAEQAEKDKILAEVKKFKSDHSSVLSLTEKTVSLSKEQAVLTAKQELENCSDAAKTYLQNEIKLINALAGRVEELKEIKTEVDEFLGNEAYSHIWNKKILDNDFNLNYTNYVSFIQLALLNYDLLSDEAKQMVSSEYEWLKKLDEEAKKYLEADTNAAELAEKVAEFQKIYLYVFTLNENSVTESDRGAIQMVIDAYNMLEDENLKNALAPRIEALSSMLELLDELEDENDDNSSGESETVVETQTVTKTNKITDTIIKTLGGETGLSNTVLILFVLLAVAVVILIITYILCQYYKKRVSFGIYEEMEV